MRGTILVRTFLRRCKSSYQFHSLGDSAPSKEVRNILEPIKINWLEPRYSFRSLQNGVDVPWDYSRRAEVPSIDICGFGTFSSLYPLTRSTRSTSHLHSTLMHYTGTHLPPRAKRCAASISRIGLTILNNFRSAQLVLSIICKLPVLTSGLPSSSGPISSWKKFLTLRPEARLSTRRSFDAFPMRNPVRLVEVWSLGKIHVKKIASCRNERLERQQPRY